MGGQTLIRLGLLALLPLIAWAIWRDGQRYDPGLLDFQGAAARLSPLAAYLPERVGSLRRLGESRRYQKENLHDYVNGHAEFFIGAGFRELLVGEYGVGEVSGGPLVVVDLYDMGRPLHAFGVVTQESPGESRPSEIGEMGSRDARGLRFIRGAYYVKMTAFADDAPLEALARAVAGAMGQGGGGVGSFRFPAFGESLSTRFIKDNYRGLDFFDNVVERSFRVAGGGEVQGFLAGDSEAESRELASRLTAFLTREEIPFQVVEQEGLAVTAVQDPYEGAWFFLRVGEQVVGAFGLPLEAAFPLLRRFVDDGDATRKR